MIKDYAFPSVDFDSGMLLRDYFAAKAMQGLISNKSHTGLDTLTVSIWAYSMADAMMKVRKE